MDELNLNNVYLLIPSRFENGHITAYREKAIETILRDNNIDEINFLRSWLAQQITDYNGTLYPVVDIRSLTVKTLEMFQQLGVHPKGCVYTVPETEDGNALDE